jgi:Ca2+/Na+ antiporter
MAKKKYKIKPKQAHATGEAPKQAVTAHKKKKESDFPFVKNNYILFAVGILVIIVGFIFLAIGDITLSPILLIVGYCVIIPIALLYGRKEKKAEEQTANITGD